MTDTDPVPEEPVQAQYGFLARLIGLPILEERLLDAIEQLIGTSEADKQALVAAAASLRNTDVTVDAIEPEPFNHQAKRTHTGHRDGNPGASNKKGTKP